MRNEQGTRCDSDPSTHILCNGLVNTQHFSLTTFNDFQYEDKNCAVACLLLQYLLLTLYKFYIG